MHVHSYVSIMKAIGCLIVLLGLLTTISTADQNKRKNRNGHKDFEDENDVSLSLTLPESEDYIFEPEEDDITGDENDPELDDEDDLEDLDGNRVISLDNNYYDDAWLPLDNPPKDNFPEVANRELLSKTESHGIVPTQNSFMKLNSTQHHKFNTTRKIKTTLSVITRLPRGTIPPDNSIPARRTKVFDLPPVRIPPQITNHPLSIYHFKKGEHVDLPCDASGDPKPQFYWKKNDVFFQNISVESSNGSLFIKSPAVIDEGIYQCFATNGFGVAVSDKVVLKMAVLESFPTKDANVNTKSVGEPLKLICNPPISHPIGIIYWGVTADKLRPIDSSERISIDYNGTLYFANLEAGDSRHGATYVCVVSNPILKSLMQGDDQIIKAVENPGEPVPHAPVLVWSSHDTISPITALVGRDLKMKCIFSGYPTPKVKWIDREGNELKGERMKLTNDSHGLELVISNIATTDEGSYSCSATNSASETAASHKFQIIVESPPIWRIKPEDVNTSEEETVKISCPVTGNPPPTLSWSINGIPTNDLPVDTRRTVDGDTITFENVSLSDTQVVQCNATNKHGSIFANVYMTVRAEHPTIVEEFAPKVKIAEEQDVTILCSATGAPKPVITWKKDNVSLVIDGTTSRISSETGSLVIKRAILTDQGSYTCHAQNRYGTDEKTSFLIVREKTKILSPPQSQTVNATSEVVLRCEVKTDEDEQENLKVVWHKDGRPLDVDAGDYRFDPSDNSLTIKSSKVSDSGKYECTADNGVDSDDSTSEIIVKDRPDPPVNISVSNCEGPGDAIVTWQPGSNNNDDVIDFRIYFNTSFESSSWVMDESKSKGHRIEMSLLPWRNYSFYVTARNSLGTSDPSGYTIMPCTTAQKKPVKNPEGVCSEMRKPGQLVIVWQPLRIDELNGEEFHYLVTYKKRGSSDSEQEIIKDWKQKELSIHGLEVFKPYEISVQAVNKIGTVEEPLQRRIVYSGEGRPLIVPQNFGFNETSLNSSSVSFTWDPIPENSDLIQGFFRGYQVKFWKSSDPDDVRTVDALQQSEPDFCPAISSSLRRRRKREERNPVVLAVNNLWPFSKIQAGVVVLNGFTGGNMSNVVEFDTPEGVPSPVLSVKVTETGSNHFILTWGRPLELNGNLKAYIIGYKTGGSQEQDVFIWDPSANTRKLDNLLSNADYTIKMWAMTGAGRSVESWITAKTNLAGAPDKPIISRLDYEAGTDYVVVSWRPVEEGKARNPASRHYVEHRKADSNNWTRSFTDEATVNITDLEIGSEYVFRLVANNSEHESRSDESHILIGDPVDVNIIELPEPTLETVDNVNVNLTAVGSLLETNTASSNWYIILIVLLIFFIIILIIILVLRYNSGGIYRVWKKEMKHEKTPTKDEEFKEFHRNHIPAENYISEKPTLLADIDNESLADSLGEFDDDPDTARFNEDGSFIGQYGGKDDEKEDKDAPSVPTSPNLHLLNTFV